MCQGFEVQEFEVLEFMLPRSRPPRGAPRSHPPPRGRPVMRGPLRKMVPPLLAALDAGQLPDYRHVGKLNEVYNPAQNQGLYLLEFTINGQRRGYSGMSDDLARRLKAHRLCANVMGISPAGIDVYVATDASGVSWRARERALHLQMRQKAPNVLTNQRLELEFDG